MEQKKSSFGNKVIRVLVMIYTLQKVKVIIGVALLGLILILLVDIHSNPVEMVQEFEEAVAMGDSKKLSRLISPRHKVVKIDEKRLQQFVEYAQKNPDYFQKQMQILRAQIAYHAESDENAYSAIEGITTTRELLEAGDFYIKKTNFLLFDYYEIVVRDMYLILTTNEADVVLYVDGEKVFKTTEKEKRFVYGPAISGIYEVTAEKEFEYASLKGKDEVNLFKQKNKNNISVHLELVGETEKLNSNFEDTIVYVSGKKMGVFLREQVKVKLSQ